MCFRLLTQIASSPSRKAQGPQIIAPSGAGISGLHAGPVAWGKLVRFSELHLLVRKQRLTIPPPQTEGRSDSRVRAARHGVAELQTKSLQPGPPSDLKDRVQLKQEPNRSHSGLVSADATRGVRLEGGQRPALEAHVKGAEANVNQTLTHCGRSKRSHAPIRDLQFL